MTPPVATRPDSMQLSRYGLIINPMIPRKNGRVWRHDTENASPPGPRSIQTEWSYGLFVRSCCRRHRYRTEPMVGQSGDPNNLADAIHAISEHLLDSNV